MTRANQLHRLVATLLIVSSSLTAQQGTPQSLTHGIQKAAASPDTAAPKLNRTQLTHRAIVKGRDGDAKGKSNPAQLHPCIAGQIMKLAAEYYFCQDDVKWTVVSAEAFWGECGDYYQRPMREYIQVTDYQRHCWWKMELTPAETPIPELLRNHA